MTNPPKEKGNYIKFIVPVLLLFGFLLIITPFVLNRTDNPKNEKLWIDAKSSDLNIEAISSDSTGAESNSEYVLKSKVELSKSEIQKNLKIEPATDFDIQEINSQEYKIKLEKVLAEDEVYKFSLPILERGVDNSYELIKDLSWAFQVKSTPRILGSLPDHMATGVPVNSGIEIYFSHDGIDDISKFFEISPKVNGRFEKHDRTIVFIPEKLEYSEVYTVKIKPGIALDGSEETIKKEFSFSFETLAGEGEDQFAENMYFGKSMYEFTPDVRPTFTIISGVEVSNLKGKVYQFKDQNDFIETIKQKETTPKWAYNSRGKYKFDTAKLNLVNEYSELNPEGGNNYSGYIVLPETINTGYYLVELEQNEKQKIQALFQITTLNSTFIKTDSESLVWVVDSKTISPLSGVSVKLDSSSSAEIGKTADDGTFRLDVDEEKNKYVLLKSLNNEELVIPIEDPSIYSFSYEYNDTWNENADYWSNLYSDKELYMPTDTVNVWGLAKNRDSKTNDEKIRISIKSNYYNYFKSPVEIIGKDLNLSSLGTFTDKLSFENLEPGYYTLMISTDKNETILSKGFTVEKYVKPAYKINLKTDKDFYFWNEEVRVTGEVSFFEGSPVPNLKLNYSGEKEGSVTTDGNGKFNIKFSPNFQRENIDRYSYLYVRPASAEEGDIEAGTSAHIFNHNVNISTDSEKVENNAKIKITLNEISLEKLNFGNPDGPEDYLGKLLGNKKLNVETIESWYEKIETGEDYYDYINKVNVKGYNYEWREKSIGIKEITTNEKGEANFEFNTDESKYYTLKISTDDYDGSKVITETFISGYNYTYPSNEVQYGIDIKNKKENYNITSKINEKLEVRMTKNGNVAPDNNPYLFVTSQRKIQDSVVTKSPYYTFDFKEKHIPNIFVRGITFDGNSFHDSQNLRIDMDTDERKLEVDVNSDSQNYKPKDKVDIGVMIKDLLGNTKKGEVNISVVDEALFKIEEQFVNPLETVYTKVPSGITNTFLSHQNPLLDGGGRGDACFLPGTKILMSNGKTKNIEDVQEGEYILTKENDFSNNFVNSEVVNVQKHKSSGYLLINNQLRITPVHIIFADGKWGYARDLEVGQYLLGNDGQWIEIESIKSYAYNDYVYNLEVKNTHTYFADGYYVHNSKGGREYFADTAFFGSSLTNDKGEASFSFEVPDNLTSWRVTAQSISDDLFVGNTQYNFNVKIPYFVDTVVNDSYLVDDKPIIKIRSFGEALDPNSNVEYTISSETLKIDNQKINSKASESAFYNLPTLTEGKHKITVEAKNGDLSDKLTKEFNVVKTNLRNNDTKLYTYKDGVEIKGNENGYTMLTLTDINGGKYYRNLIELGNSWGNRIDQKLARIEAINILKNQFTEDIYWWDEDLEPTVYQKGGVSLLPYSSEDLELSAKVADISLKEFSESSLLNYFLGVVEDPDESRDRKIIALYGLSSLNESILIKLYSISELEDLTPNEKVYLGLSFAKLGDKEKARVIYYELAEKYEVEEGEEKYLKVSDNMDENMMFTVNAMRLGSLIDEVSAINFYDTVSNYNTGEFLTVLEEVTFIKELGSKIKTPPVKFEYNGKKYELINGSSEIIYVDKENLSNFKLANLSGEVGIVSTFEKTVDSNSSGQNENLTLKRTYLVNGVPTNKFKENDLIKVSIDFKVENINDCFEISDYLPSGMKPVTMPYQYVSLDDQSTRWYPFEVNGQKISFCVYGDNGYRKSPLYYYARVVSKGEYKTEPTIVQSAYDLENYNILNDQQVITVE